MRKDFSGFRFVTAIHGQTLLTVLLVCAILKIQKGATDRRLPDKKLKNNRLFSQDRAVIFYVKLGKPS